MLKQFEVKNIYIGEVYSWPLRFKAEEANSTIQLNKTGSPTSVTLETSTDGSTWSTYTFWTTITLNNIWDKVSFRNTSTSDTGFSTDYNNYYQFVMTGSISAEWDTNYLLNKNSTTTVSSYCYYYMFYNCTSLTTAPSLPATTLASYCYYDMFYWCTSLTTAPQLPATALANYCYSYMFYNCKSLTTSPSLPATTLATQCYHNMFLNCKSLTTLPALPATTLAGSCYNTMFSKCSKIKLSATQTWEYQTAYRIPTTWTWTSATGALYMMFYNTGW